MTGDRTGRDDRRDIQRVAEHWQLSIDDLGDIDSVLRATRSTYARVRELAGRRAAEVVDASENRQRRVTPVLGRDRTGAQRDALDDAPGLGLVRR